MSISKEEIEKVFNPENYPVPEYFKLKMVDHDPFNEKEFHIANSYVAYKNHTFYRFNEEELNKVRPVTADVAWLATHSAGIQLQFSTNSRFIELRVKNNDSFSMKNMSFVGMCGFDCYFYSEKYKKFLFSRSSTFPNFIDDKKWIGEVACFPQKEERKIIINFPLYSGVLDLTVLLEDGATISPWKYEEEKKIVCYGTSILQGCSSSRPGIATTNQLSRYFKQEVVNYGFSGAANLEKEVAEVIASRDDIEIFTVDCEANAGMSANLCNRIDEFMDIFYSKHPDVPVVIFNRLRAQYDYDGGFYPNHADGHKLCDRKLKEVVERYKKQGKNIRFVDNYALFGEDESEFTIEALHPSDVGMNAITQNYIKAIKDIKEGR